MSLTRTPKKKFATAHMMIKSVPVSLRNHFKAWAALRGRSMRELFIEFMEEKIKERQTQ